MKSIRVHEFGAPGVLHLEEVADPRPQTGQVLVRVKAAGVNPVETYLRAGTYASKPGLPWTPGTDGAGVVEAVGAGVKKFVAGDRVYFFGCLTGAYAELALCEEAQVFPLPANITFAQGAALGVPYGTAYYALFQRGRAQPGDTLLIHGATGGVGTAAVQIARARGLTVIGTGGTQRGRAMIETEGAHHVLDHRAPGYLEALPALTGGRGVDIILEMLANVNLDHDLEALAPHGRVVVVGSRGRIEIDPRRTMGRNADIRGLTLMNATPQEIVAIHAALGAGLENGSLRPIIGAEWPLGEAARAHEDVMRPDAYGKTVLLP
jgi:NADPH2:quinone reductase